MRDSNQRLQQEGSGSRMASHAVHTPPREAFFSLFTCPYSISQQSHQSGPYALPSLRSVECRHKHLNCILPRGCQDNFQTLCSLVIELNFFNNP